jgi:secreted trypsin-like serine protease
VRLRLVVASAAIVLAGIAIPVLDANASVQPVTNIVGGNTVSSAPWAAAVLLKGAPNCSGSIIAAQWVLTAAHCRGLTPAELSVRVGSVSLTAGGFLSGVDDVMVRTSKSGSLISDIALLHLRTPIQTTYVVLANTDPRVGATDSIYGWGATCVNDNPRPCNESMSPTLKTAKVAITALDVTDNSGGRGIQSSWVSGGAWRGDSGGPQLDHGVQVGFASLAGPDGGQGRTAQIYGSVAYNRAWITATAGV